jgi:hypothetical protein
MVGLEPAGNLLLQFDCHGGDGSLATTRAERPADEADTDDSLEQMNLNLSVDEVLTTTRSVRKRLDFDKPVSRDVLTECLELALQAPTGSNSQGWQWVFVDDPDKKKAIGEIYLANGRVYLNPMATPVGSEWARSEIPRPTSPSTCMRHPSC